MVGPQTTWLNYYNVTLYKGLYGRGYNKSTSLAAFCMLLLMKYGSEPNLGPPGAASPNGNTV